MEPDNKLMCSSGGKPCSLHEVMSLFSVFMSVNNKHVYSLSG